MSEEVKNKSEYLVEVRDLKQYFPIKTGFMKTTPLKAVDGVSFSIKPGETLGLVGESGCGKTTVGRSLLRLYTPTSGDVFFDGERVDEKSIGHMRKQMQMVFQDPYSSLNPRMTVEDIIGEPLDVHKLYTSRGERRDKILHLMELVGLNAEHATRYAHEFSGGQRQRIAVDIQLNFAFFKAGQFGFHDELVIFFSNVCFETADGFFADKTVIKIRKWV